MHLISTLGLGSPPLTWWDMSARALVALAYGIAIIRMFGRRIFARWSALDIVIAVSIGSTLSRAITGPIAFWPAIAASTVMVLAHRGLALASVRYPWVERLVEGRPIILARNGVEISRTLANRGITAEDIAQALRAHGLESVEQTLWIMLEPNGQISVRPRPSPDRAAAHPQGASTANPGG